MKRTRLGQSARDRIVRLLRRRWFREVVVRAPVLPGHLGERQFWFWKRARQFMKTDAEKEAVDRKLAKIDRANIALAEVKELRPSIEQVRAQNFDNTLSALIHLYKTAPDQRAEALAAIPKPSAISLARALRSDLNDRFTFKPEVFEAFRDLAEINRDVTIAEAAASQAPTLGQALEALSFGDRLTIFKNGARINSTRDVSDAAAPTLVLVDNGVDIGFCDDFCRRQAPEAKVLFNHRIKEDPNVRWEDTKTTANWEPIIEGNIAYYTAGEEALDAEFLSFWAEQQDIIDSLFTADGDRPGQFADFGVLGAKCLKFLFEDSVYLAFREFYGWKAAFDQHVRGKTGQSVLILTKRADFVNALALLGCFTADDTVIAIHGVEPDQILAMKSAQPSMNSLHAPPIATVLNNALRHFPESLQYDPQLANLDIRERMRDHFASNAGRHITRSDPYTIITTSSNQNYADYALRIVKEYGWENCTVIDLNPHGKSTGLGKLLTERGTQHVVLTVHVAMKDISAWKRDIAKMLQKAIFNEMLQRPVRDHVMTYLILVSDQLSFLTAQFMRLYAMVVFLSEHFLKWNPGEAGTELKPQKANESVTNRKPVAFLVPGRTSVGYLLSEYSSNATFVDVQFFINSESFRYKRPVSDLTTVIDSTEEQIYRDRYGVPPDRIAKLGSPSIDTYLRRAIGDVRHDFRGTDESRRILVVGQPIQFPHWYELLEGLRRLTESDPRYRITIKLHPQNSYGTVEVFKGRIGRYSLGAFTFERAGSIYPMLMQHDAVVGWTSNTLMEAASMRKAVFLLDGPEVSRFMKDRSIGSVVAPSELGDKLHDYFENALSRDHMRGLQDGYFRRHPEMDALNKKHDTIRELLAFVDRYERRGATA